MDLEKDAALSGSTGEMPEGSPSSIDLELQLKIAQERTKQVKLAEESALKQARLATELTLEQARVAANAKTLPWRICLTVLLWLILAGLFALLLFRQDKELLLSPIGLAMAFLGAVGTQFILSRKS